jgi:hypothetical protein
LASKGLDTDIFKKFPESQDVVKKIEKCIIKITQMNKSWLKKLTSTLLITTVFLVFWCCLENCAEKGEEESNVSGNSQIVQVEKTEDESCSIQNSPSAVVSAQETFTSVNISNSLPDFSFKIFSKPDFQFLAKKTGAYNFSPLPLRILPQLRI